MLTLEWDAGVDSEGRAMGCRGLVRPVDLVQRMLAEHVLDGVCQQWSNLRGGAF
jgi:hypothetical protein